METTLKRILLLCLLLPNLVCTEVDMPPRSRIRSIMFSQLNLIKIGDGYLSLSLTYEQFNSFYFSVFITILIGVPLVTQLSLDVAATATSSHSPCLCSLNLFPGILILETVLKQDYSHPPKILIYCKQSRISNSCPDK